MAQKTIVTLEDDLDGGPADETLTFALDGVTYEIDLNEDNAQALRDALAPYVGNARRVSGRSTARSSSRGSRAASAPAAAPARRQDSASIREWARQNGHTVNERGRIPAAVLEAYEQAHS
ncbi:histone-like nucleoid-structuring protein Lsr2 [Motilibacter deserti]|uniref:Lsr2 family protein n=1 Tax=Motilibacter deserti TaxID=2714956 RepID=A0ABX0GXT8_9ACTN|nr:Lsr2 family protein [Motilibacter deserti]NHC15793.1 Lsr2 family protein [Motilibacter deserti]